MESNHITEELLYEIALSRLEGIGSVLYKNLLSHFGSARDVFRIPAGKLLRVSGIGAHLVKEFSRKEETLREAAKIIEGSVKKDIRIIPLRSPEYPPALREIYDCPPVLYFRGNGEIRQHRTLAIVGTRDATAYGKEVVTRLMTGLSDIQIISGLAYGIDITAHREALKNNLSTLGVLANGLDTVYPSSHRKVAEEMLEHGLLISEQPVFTKLHPQFFVSRNRIIAGLSEVVLVVESGKKGGSMVTAEFANNYNREVFAVPGDLCKKQSEGTHQLIFDHKAHIFTDAATLIDWMRWGSGEKATKKEWDLTPFTDEEKAVLTLLLERGEMQIDELSWYAQVPPGRLPSILLNLEFQDVIKQAPGKKFSVKR